MPTDVNTGSGEKQSAARLSVLVALGLALLKTAAFLATGSVAVLASAADSLMDVLASGVNYGAIRVAETPADHEHRYGHGKAEGMAGLFQSLVIGVSAAFLIYESIRRLSFGPDLQQPITGITVMAVSMVVSALLVRRLRRVAREQESLALAADSLHYLSDVLANACVLAALAAYALTGATWIDPVMSLGLSIWILWSVWAVLRESVDNLMDRELPEEERARIRKALLGGADGIRGYHDLRTRRSGSCRFVDVHLEVDRELSFVDAHRVAEDVVAAIEGALPLTLATVHADPWPPDPED